MSDYTIYTIVESAESLRELSKVFELKMNKTSLNVPSNELEKFFLH